MMTEADVQHNRSTPGQRKSKRERRREDRRRMGERQCEVCRHARMDHTAMRNTRDTFCHACTAVCATK